MNRVVITGIGLVTPLGCGVQNTWNALISGKCGVQRLESSDYDKIPSKVAARVPRGDSDDTFLNSEKYVLPSELRTMSPASLFALVASDEAIKDANIPEDDNLRYHTGVAIGMGMSDLEYIVESAHIMKNKGPSRISPYFVPRILTNMAAGIVSIRHKLEGPNHSVSTACATGAHSIGDAANFIRYGMAKAMICGGTESCITPLSMAGFSRLRALSTKFNSTPEKSSRPFDLQRDGFVMGEGSGILFLEELEHALSRKARIYAEVIGYGTSGDASHLTAPSENGAGACRAMQNALKDARIRAEDISYINAHATSTPLGDAIEVNAVGRVFRECDTKPWIRSMKGYLGHGQGAAGAMETCLAVTALDQAVLPPNFNLEEPDAAMLDHVRFCPNFATPWPLQDDQQRRRIFLKNSFGFGGTNASLCIASYP